MAKTFRPCPKCGKKGVYVINGWPYWGSGPEQCRYCHKYFYPDRPDSDSYQGVTNRCPEPDPGIMPVEATVESPRREP